MKVPIDKFNNHVGEFFLLNIIPNVKGNLNQFLLGMAMPSLVKKLDDAMVSFDIASQDGYIDLDMLDSMMESGFNASGGKVTMDLDMKKFIPTKDEKLIFSFVKADWDNLCERMMS